MNRFCKSISNKGNEEHEFDMWTGKLS